MHILHFVDNQGALSSLIGGFTAQEDVAPISCLYQLLLVSMGAMAWLEYVESEANIADLPSRPESDWASSDLRRELGISLEPASLPDLPTVFQAPADALSRFEAVRNLVP